MPRSFELTCAPALARVLAGGSQPQAGLRQLDAALARDLGHRLFTVLALDWTRGLSVRHYSSAPLAYPPGGAKPIVPGGEFHARVIEAGEPRFCADADAIRAAFPDHELILSLGCESAVNVPVRWNGRTLGSLNLLHEAGWYGEDMLPVLRVYGAMAVPLLQQIHLDRSHDHTTTGETP
ncbi:GAF domain-containing protein [Achromobacter xylosoxidans]